MACVSRKVELSGFRGQATSAFRDSVADRTVLPAEPVRQGTILRACRPRAAGTASSTGNRPRVKDARRGHGEAGPGGDQPAGREAALNDGSERRELPPAVCSCFSSIVG